MLPARTSAEPAQPQAGRWVTYHRGVSNAPAGFTVPVALLLLVLAAIAAVNARRGWAGTLTRTGRLGIHSPAASASDDAFLMANRVAAPVVGGAAAIAVLLAVLVVVLPVPTALTITLGVLGLIAVIGLQMYGGVLGEAAARTMPVPARRPAPSAACSGCACGGGGCSGLTRNAVSTDAHTA